MKNHLLTLFIILLGQQVIAQSQAELNMESYEDYQSIKKEMLHIYNQIRAEYKGEKEMIKNLVRSQELWYEYRDAQMLVKFPESYQVGSVYPLCHNLYMIELTKKRIEVLSEWLKGPQKGEVCDGTIR